MNSPQTHDLIVIGGGIVGLATAYQYLQARPGSCVRLVEKESRIASHQTGRNSGVLHSGIYYKPGSLKAINCREGKRAMEEFCRAEGVPFELCGKLIVATDEAELPRLAEILARGQANGVRCEQIGPQRLRELEPHAAGLAAIHVPEAGIVDYAAVSARLAERITREGGQITLGAAVRGMRAEPGRVVVETTAGEFAAQQVVNCAGLHSDRVARLSGHRPDVRIVPFRGEYFTLKPEATHLCRALIYPVPDPAFPFLGVHFTRMIGGGVECGPNAVLAFSREGYAKLQVNLRDLAGSLSYPGFLRLAARYWRMGAGEMWRSVSKRAFVQALSRLVPEIRPEHLVPRAAGVRAQALARDGSMVDDFLISTAGRVVNVLNAPSPAATSSLRIGRQIAERLLAHDASPPPGN
ncbi:MAG TPA: L-2-hydroxyglutarate oxidase [Lacipirellulaceae bacterium]|nr:L-2-hydroxyglutarate oxidase [Lacipirellulaceae bacterium]